MSGAVGGKRKVVVQMSRKRDVGERATLVPRDSFLDKSVSLLHVSWSAHCASAAAVGSGQEPQRLRMAPVAKVAQSCNAIVHSRLPVTQKRLSTVTLFSRADGQSLASGQIVAAPSTVWRRICWRAHKTAVCRCRP